MLRNLRRIDENGDMSGPGQRLRRRLAQASKLKAAPAIEYLGDFRHVR
jgi:hypothetical protein